MPRFNNSDDHHNLIRSIAFPGLRLRYKPRQSELYFIFGAIPAPQGHTSPMAYRILYIHFTYLVRLVVTAATEKHSQIPILSIGTTLNIGG